VKLDSQAKDPVVVAVREAGVVSVLWERRVERGQEVRAVQYNVGEKENRR